MKTLVAYWQTTYDWRIHEARLNRLRQYTVPLAGIEFHRKALTHAQVWGHLTRKRR